MTASTIEISAIKLRVGMVLAFNNPRFNARIDDVQHGPNGGVTVYTDDGMSCSSYARDEKVLIVHEKKLILAQVLNTYLTKAA